VSFEETLLLFLMVDAAPINLAIIFSVFRSYESLTEDGMSI
jgi:hypothetical protein